MKMLNHNYLTLYDGKKVILDISLVIFLLSEKLPKTCQPDHFNSFVRWGKKQQI